MPERFARLTALALIVILIIALPLLVSLFGGLTAPAPTRTPNLPTAVALASPTLALPTATFPAPGVTTLPTPTPVPLPSPTAGCPIPDTPEPLWVNPVSSPTHLLSQKIAVTLGRGREISITSEAGTFTQLGEFSTAQPVEIEIPLLANLQNHLKVSGKVEYAPGCFYNLQTSSDRVGTPLVIVQNGAQTPPTLAVSPTPPAPGTVYLKPFSQVFAINQDAPGPTDQLWLYEGAANTPFQVAGLQGAFTHMVSQDGTLNFWTLNDNVVPTSMPAPVFDDTFAGRSVEFVGEKIFACEAQFPSPLLLGQCAEITGVTQGEVVQRAQVESSVLYEVRINTKLYWVSSNVLKGEPTP